jgi:hypothetical protein
LPERVVSAFLRDGEQAARADSTFDRDCTRQQHDRGDGKALAEI